MKESRSKEPHLQVRIDDNAIPVESGVFSRLDKLLKDRGLEPIVVGGVIIFVAAAVATAHFLNRQKQIEIEIVQPPLTSELEDKLASLYEQHRAKIHMFFEFGKGLDHPVAEDLVQQVFTRARNKIGEFKPNPELADPYKAWLYTIAANLSKNYRRDQSRHPSVPLDTLESSDEESTEHRFVVSLEKIVSHDESSLEDQVIEKEEANKLKEAIRQLLPRYQLVIWLKSLEFKNEEIASVLGGTEGSVKSLYNRALNSLKHHFDEKGKIDSHV